MNRIEKQRRAQANKGLVPAPESPRKLPQPVDTCVSTAQEQPRKFPLPRLPDGAHDEARWDAGRGVWSGRLHIPTGDGSHVHFNAEAQTRLTLLSKLDKLYRAWCKKEVA